MSTPLDAVPSLLHPSDESTSLAPPLPRSGRFFAPIIDCFKTAAASRYTPGISDISLVRQHRAPGEHPAGGRPHEYHVRQSTAGRQRADAV